MKKVVLSIIFILSLINFCNSQNIQDKTFWSKDLKLKESDYIIKVNSDRNTPIYSQFVVKFGGASNFEMIGKNFNQKVENVFLPNSSWIVDSKKINKENLLFYQQTIFNINEIFARKFRKQLLINKMKVIFRGNKFIDEIFNELLAENSKRVMEFEKETNQGRNFEIVRKKALEIDAEIVALDEFRFENKEKIKLKK